MKASRAMSLETIYHKILFTYCGEKDEVKEAGQFLRQNSW